MYDPFNPKRIWNRVRIFVATTWILSLVCAGGPLIGWHKFALNVESTQCGLATTESTLHYSYMVFLAIAVYSIPMFLNVLSFILLFKVVHKHVTRLGQSAIFNQSSITSQKRTVVTFLLILVSYVISWTPFFMYGLLKIAEAKLDLAGQYLTVAYILGFSSTVYNPIIFAFRNENFRESVKEIILSVCGRDKRKFETVTNTTLTSSFSFQIFRRNESEFGSAWYIDRSAVMADHDACFESPEQISDGNDAIILRTLRGNREGDTQ